MAVEILARGRLRVYTDVAAAVDAMLAKQPVHTQVCEIAGLLDLTDWQCCQFAGPHRVAASAWHIALIDASTAHLAAAAS